jgi:hypothetical protein
VIGRGRICSSGGGAADLEEGDHSRLSGPRGADERGGLPGHGADDVNITWR